MNTASCELCQPAGSHILWQSTLCRVVRVDDAHYPGFCRVILNRHVREMTDLQPDERAALMRVVFAVEQALRDVLQPEKINLASFGNMVPHVHWHVIPRWSDDRHFPEPVWGQVRRDPAGVRPVAYEAIRVRLVELLHDEEGLS